MMQFQFNSDYPGSVMMMTTTTEQQQQQQVDDSFLLQHQQQQQQSFPSQQSFVVQAKNPQDFPPAQPLPCARITTRVFHPNRNQVATVQNVLVRTNLRRQVYNNNNNNNGGTGGTGDSDDVSWSSNGMSSTSSDESMTDQQQQQQQQAPSGSQQQHAQQPQQQSQFLAGFPTQQQQQQDYYYNNNDEDEEEDNEIRAYWIQRTVREAIYGRVLFAIVLRKRTPTMALNDNAEWEVTNYYCAVKEMSWQHIRRERDRLAEDPIKEVSAMQYLKRWDHSTRQQQSQQSQQQLQSQQQQSQQQSSTLSATNVTTTTSSSSFRNRTNNNTRDDGRGQGRGGREDDDNGVNNNNNNNNNPQSSLLSTTTTTSSSSFVMGGGDGDGILQQSFQSILETNLMMPLDLLSDDRHLYSIMPYCDGGELFERLDLNERFTENEARYWMYQILNGLENLQNAGITHRDLSLENLLVHQSGALIIDMGMCLRVPFDEEVTTVGLSASFNNMNMNGGGIQQQVQQQPQPITSTMSQQQQSSQQQQQQQQPVLSGRRRRRHLLNPQGTCGKWIYMSPEIYKNQKPFDGFAVDMWAAGVILFLMLTGFPPWERACQTDERFKYMSAGYLVQMLTEWDVGLSSDAMDLLQRMLFLDPKDRLSLDQVRAHPWMMNGPLQGPE